MKVLIACEESQRVCIAFRELGHEAYSCDIEPCSGGYPGWHIQADVILLINGKCKFKTMDGIEHIICTRWDLLIAHPPCTYLTNAGAVRIRVKGKIVKERYQKAMEAKEFFLRFLNADCVKIAVENPVPMKIVDLPRYSQIIQPYEYGHPYSKRTCLWLKNLPKLKPTKILDCYSPYVNAGSKNADGSYRKKQGLKERDPKSRSKTFPGIAKAMAQQWGGIANMSLIDDIKAESEGKLNGQTEQERDFEKCLNRLFYLDKNIEKETEFIKMVMTRGQETAERKGLHCSNIISAYSPFCLRGQVLSLFYRQKQNKGISVPLMRIFAEGDAIHEKWQRLFIRAGYAEPHMCDRTMFDDRYDLSYTPDIICEIHNTMYIGEIKSVNTNQFKRLVTGGEDHTAGIVQCYMYMYLTGIHDGFVLCEDKNTQEFYVRLYTFDQTVIQTYIDRLDAIQEAKKYLVKHGKIPKRIEVCECYGCKCANDCVMADVCYGKTKERI